ncbi:MAG: hypothetical protein EZS28_014438 [Streblomastix strix]|uniref:Uncharacterized protein n=1 Tax=Streblomastix strix TaxID=222440 RepID=A0A5J4W4X6_9EUKA|nr:MAG: hypothetical protein EZS28_014438 [Streblomastix strix]
MYNHLDDAIMSICILLFRQVHYQHNYNRLEWIADVHVQKSGLQLDVQKHPLSVGLISTSLQSSITVQTSPAHISPIQKHSHADRDIPLKYYPLLEHMYQLGYLQFIHLILYVWSEGKQSVGVEPIRVGFMKSPPVHSFDARHVIGSNVIDNKSYTQPSYEYVDVQVQSVYQQVSFPYSQSFDPIGISLYSECADITFHYQKFFTADYENYFSTLIQSEYHDHQME